MDSLTFQTMQLAQAGASDAVPAFARTPAIATVPPDDLAARQFSDLMGPVSPAQEATQRPLRPEALAGQQSLGDAILTGLTQLTSDVQKAWIGVHAGFSSEITPVSMSEIYAKQVQLMDFTLQYQVIGHGLSKANQDLNDLLKLQ